MANTDSEKSLVLITGMSGAGRKAAATVLEEMGWYVADNLPAELIMRMVEISFDSETPIERLAIVTDVRSRAFAGSLGEVLEKLQHEGKKPVVLYLDATDDVLIKRFDTVRRTHPLQGEDTLQVGIDREREMLAEIRGRADIILDTSQNSIHDLRRDIEQRFSSLDDNTQRITIESFGFKHGVPRDMDMMVDARFLPNPYWVEELRPYRGTDAAVSDYVLSQEGAENFIQGINSLVEGILPGYKREGKNHITVAIGCTGGHHRSVAVAEELARRLTEKGHDVYVLHRDLSVD